MPLLFPRGLLAFDTETTGTDARNDRIVTCCVAHVRPDGTVGSSHHWLINAGVEIPKEASDIHGITTEKVQAEGRPIELVLPEIRAWFSRAVQQEIPLCAFNAAFDCTLLDAEFLRYGAGFPFESALIFDSLVVDKALDKFRKGSRKLLDVAREYGAELSADDAHDAQADAVAAGQIALLMSVKYKRLGPDGEYNWSNLMEVQAAWHEEQASSYEQYLRKTKPDAIVDRGWPIKAEVQA